MKTLSSITEESSTCVKVPCTCGELFQGVLDGEPCLVSCPIDIFSTARIIEPAVQIPYGRKVGRALDWIHVRTNQMVGVEITDPLPVGRGYGTSTADIGSTLFAANQAFNLDLTSNEASKIAIEIEPTDSTLFSGLTLFAHRTGSFNFYLGSAPAANVIILDPGGMVDSEDFNTHDWSDPLAKMVHEQKDAFLLLQQAVAAEDLYAIAEASTISAKCHQAILFNPLIESIQPLAKQLRAAGICRAHSGTIIGLIFAKDTNLSDEVDYLKRKLPKQIQVRTVSLIGGGPILIYKSESEGDSR